MRGRRTRAPKRIGLPRPPRRAPDELRRGVEARAALEELVCRRDTLAYHLELLDAEIEALAIGSLGEAPEDPAVAADGSPASAAVGGGAGREAGRPVDVELYDGGLGVGRLFVDHHEPAVGQLRWLGDLGRRFGGRGDCPGDVAGVRWGSGAMVSDDLFLTAGHCFDPAGGGWRRPRRGGEAPPPSELATLMEVVFDYQLDGQTGELRPGESFPVVELVEHRLGGLDFAVARLGAGDSGELPGIRHGRLEAAATDLVRPGAALCLIQHPHGAPKRLETGSLLAYERGRILYDGLDTLGGSSGACILSTDGSIVGVHTHGGCTALRGANFGVAIGAIRAVSEALPPAARRRAAGPGLLRLVR